MSIRRFRPVLVLLVGLGVGGCVPEHSPVTPQSEYVGRYALNPDFVLNVFEQDSLLMLLPTFWGTTQVLDSVAPDRFVSLLHPQIAFHFIRGNGGTIAALEVTGHRELAGTARRLGDDERLPVELALAGETEASLAALHDSTGALDTARAVALASRMTLKLPSMLPRGMAMLRVLAPSVRNSVDFEETQAFGSMMSGDRDAARAAFGKMLELDPHNEFAQSALRYLDPRKAARTAPGGWELPFSLDSLFAPPTVEEIASVVKDWASRDLRPRGVETVVERSLSVHGTDYQVRIVAHQVHGDRHVGAILVPRSATPGCCGVVLDLHGVAWNYPDFALEEADMVQALARSERPVIIVIPVFRGTALTFGGERWEAGGSPVDAWDGAADDAIAFLNVALDLVPEADSSRICAAGKSRGGTVALLVGERDRRIDCVVDWTGPTDWFRAMHASGWTFEEQVRWGLDHRWIPGQGWGSAAQFIQQNLRGPIDRGVPALSQVRHHMIASSPLYFVDHLPATQIHYGVEDAIVPRANGDALVAALDHRPAGAPPFEAHFHEHAGHDQPYPLAYRQSQDFILNALYGP